MLLATGSQGQKTYRLSPGVSNPPFFHQAPLEVIHRPLLFSTHTTHLAFFESCCIYYVSGTIFMFAQNGGFRYELDAFVCATLVYFVLGFRHGCCPLLVPPVLADAKMEKKLFTTIKKQKPRKRPLVCAPCMLLTPTSTVFPPASVSSILIFSPIPRLLRPKLWHS